MAEQFVKLLLIGDSGVGKSCILKRYVDDKFVAGFYNTIGVQFCTKQINIDGKNIKLQIWDTAGQQRFRSITSNYYRGVHGVLVIFDLTDKESFQHLSYWLEEIEKHNSNTNSVVILVGNKSDLDEKRVIQQQQASRLAAKNNIEYIQSSALNSANIKLVFQTIAKRALRQKNKNKSQQTLETATKQKLHENRGSSLQDNYKKAKNKVKSQCC